MNTQIWLAMLNRLLQDGKKGAEAYFQKRALDQMLWCKKCMKHLPSDSICCSYCGSKDLVPCSEVDFKRKAWCQNCAKRVPPLVEACPECGSRELIPEEIWKLSSDPDERRRLLEEREIQEQEIQKKQQEQEKQEEERRNQAVLEEERRRKQQERDELSKAVSDFYWRLDYSKVCRKCGVECTKDETYCRKCASLVEERTKEEIFSLVTASFPEVRTEKDLQSLIDYWDKRRFENDPPAKSSGGGECAGCLLVIGMGMGLLLLMAISS